MFLLAEGGLYVGDMIIQLVVFLFLILIISGIVTAIKTFRRRGHQLNRIEEKLDQLIRKKRDNEGCN